MHLKARDWRDLIVDDCEKNAVNGSTWRVKLNVVGASRNIAVATAVSVLFSQHRKVDRTLWFFRAARNPVPPRLLVTASRRMLSESISGT